MLSRVAVRAYSSAVKVVTQESASEITNLSVIINNAGSKAGKSGVSHLLSKYTFLNTNAKSALRFTRESELLGGVFSSQVTRDSLVLNTTFLKENLPYYVEALGNVVANTSFRPHEFTEVVLPVAKTEYQASRADNAFVALEELHQIAFRKGLGNPLYYDGSSQITLEDVQAFAAEAFQNGNVSIVAQGANEADLNQFIGESAFTTLPSGSTSAPKVSLYKGQESRIRASGKSVALIGVSVTPAEFGKYEVLSAAIGSSAVPSANAPLAKIPGASSFLYKYQDAGLFVISVTGSAAEVAAGIKQAKKIADAVTKAQLSEATELAKLSIALQSTLTNKLDIEAKDDAAPLGKFNYVAIGDLDVLPYADEL